MDLADGHVCALKYIENTEPNCSTYSVFNLGSGHGYSVLDMVEAMRAASGRPIAYEFAARRSGDIAVCYADTTKAARELGWTAKRELPEMCRGKKDASPTLQGS
jgi:UDP-glucose 4-epimerase